MTEALPANLRRALAQGWHLDVSTLVAQLEACGIEVVVNRLQLGDPHRPAYGTVTEIYRTPRRTHDPNA